MRRDVFQAIADPTRRSIIGLIANRGMTPNAIAAYFKTSRQAVSKHLQILAECELVRQEQRGREIVYQLEPRELEQVDQWLVPFRKLWEDRFSQLDDVLSTLKNQKK